MVYGGNLIRSLTIFCAIVSLWTKVVVTLNFSAMQATAAKPACDPREPCKVGFLGLEFCSCPHGGRCPTGPDTTLTYENIKYHFCQPTTFHACNEGEVAWVRRGLRQTVFCTCPAPLRLTSEVWDTQTDTTQYKCAQARQCSTSSDVCMVRNRVFTGTKTVSLLKNLCQCPENKQCVESGQTLKSRSVELQQDIFKCSIPSVAAASSTNSLSPDEMEDYGEGGEYEEDNINNRPNRAIDLRRHNNQQK